MTAPVSLYGRGSHFSGWSEPRDLDVVAVTDDPDTPELRQAIAARLAELVGGDVVGRLPLDLHVTGRRMDTYSAALVTGHGWHLDGPELAGEVSPVTPAEWAQFMAQVAVHSIDDTPGRAVLAAIRAAWAHDDDVVVVGKVEMRERAAGTRWETLVEAAWHACDDPFDHPDTDAVMAAAENIAAEDHWFTHTGTTTRSGWAPGADLNPATAALYASQVGPEALAALAPGLEDQPADRDDAAHRWRQWSGTPPTIGHGFVWIPRAIVPARVGVLAQPPPSAQWTVYRPGVHDVALTADECRQAITEADTGGCERVDGYDNPHGRHNAPPWLAERVQEVIRRANAAWWRYDLHDWLTASIKLLGPGDQHRRHLDAVPVPAARKLSAVVMLSDPADFTGGHLTVDTGSPRRPELEQGAVIVFPAHTVHEVTAVTAGARYTAVCEAYGPPLR